jgi:hypothetical protein
MEKIHHPPASRIRCTECRRSWLVACERWRLKVVPETLEAVPYCPECHEREFGRDARRT